MSRGVGTVYVPVRINCPPEVAVATEMLHGVESAAMPDEISCVGPLSKRDRLTWLFSAWNLMPAHSLADTS